jgi:hypothetical protein
MVQSVLTKDEQDTINKRLRLQEKRIADAKKRQDELAELMKLPELPDYNPKPIKNAYDEIPFELCGRPKSIARWRRKINDLKTTINENIILEVTDIIFEFISICENWR